MERYNAIKQTFADHECQLLTTYEEYIDKKLKNTSKYKIIAVCGHIVENCWFHMFKYRGTGLLCKNCIDINHTEHNKELNLDNSYTFNLEYLSIELIKKYSENKLEINKTNECCLADLMIRDKSKIEDKWLPIQVKSTLKGRHNIYSFAIHNNYPNMFIILVCIEEEKFWIINGNQILNQCKVSIGMQKSNKYSEYSVKKEDLANKLKELYIINNNYDTFSNINTPQTSECIKEQEYITLRINYLSNLKFINSSLPQQVYDFTVNGKKIQEKLAYSPKNRIPTVKLAKNKHGLKNSPYEVGDNDFYWINIPDKETFYLIPEDILEKELIISNNINKGTCIIIFKSNWTLKYRYSYKDPDIENKLNKIFHVKTI